MRYLFGILCVCALGVMPVVGCSTECDCDDGNDCTEDACADGVCEYTAVADGSPCGNDAGICQQGSCQVACTEQGIRDAIAEGGGPYTFDCDGPQTVVTEAEIVIGTLPYPYNQPRQVILDGEGNLTVDGNETHRVFSVRGDVTVEMRGFTIAKGFLEVENGGGIYSEGTLTLINSTVSGNTAYVGGGIQGGRTLTLINSTVSGNTGNNGVGGIASEGTLTLINSTVSGNTATRGGGIYSTWGMRTLINSTVSGNTATEYGGGIYSRHGTRTLTNTLVDNDCSFQFGETASGGHNIESPGNTCGFEQLTDQVNVSAEDLKLGELADNGGPTETHALLPGSFAIDVISEEQCVDANGEPLTTDQRGQPRPETDGTMCDIGSVEVGPEL